MTNIHQIALSAIILTATATIGCEQDKPPVTDGAKGAGPKATVTAAPSGTPPAASASAAPPASSAAAGDDTVQATLAAKSGSKVTGKVTLNQVEDGVRVRVEIEGATPGKHGIHFHENADCSSDDGKSAGGHFNPEGHDHALPEKDERHVGDLGNIEADADGKGSIDFVRKGATLEPDAKTSLLGRGLIIHADPDDGGQPTGNAGDRIACAEIKPKT